MTEPKKVFFIDVPVMVMARQAVIARNEEDLNKIGADFVEKFKMRDATYKLVREKQEKGAKGQAPLVSHTLSKYWQDDWNQ